MSSDRFVLNVIESTILSCGMLCMLVVSGCDNSDNSDTSNFTEMIESKGLIGCADTDSCLSNPILQIGEGRPTQVQIPSDYTTTTR